MRQRQRHAWIGRPVRKALLILPSVATIATLALAKPLPPDVDPCVVGTWRSDGATALGMLPGPGRGSGVILIVTKQGQETVDYDAMVPFKQPVGPLIIAEHSYSGSATALFATPRPGYAALVAILNSSVITYYPDVHGNTVTHPIGKSTGPAALGHDPHGSYRCSKGSLSITNVAYTFSFKPYNGPLPAKRNPSQQQQSASNTPGGPNFNPLPDGQFCVRNAGAIADTYPCTGAVKPSGFVFTARLKKQITGPLDVVKFYTTPLTSTSGVVGVVSGGGTTVNSEYSITAPASLCMNTGTAYSVRVYSAGISQGDIGIFWPDCR
jgi:hypothetical protein